MKLSDAIALGQLLLPREEWNGGSYCKCALGMGLRAAGIEINDEGYGMEVNAIRAIDKEWPWIENEFPVPESLIGNGHLKFSIRNGYSSAKKIISAAFSEARWPGNEWSVDRIADWVRSVEPQEISESVHQEAQHEVAG